MNKKIRWAFLALLVMLFVQFIPEVTHADTSDQIYYIKNNYTQSAYLYEEDGILRYGIPMEGDKSFQWIIEENSSYKLLKNVLTNDYITLDGHGDESVEGNWGENINCTLLSDQVDNFLWEFEIGEGQNLLSPSKNYAGFALHLESALEGKPYAQKISGDQLNWGNMKWDFISQDQMDITSMTKNGFCIQNADDGTYLRIDNGFLTHGNPDGADDTYIWFIEQQTDGTKAIKNKKTSQYITLSQYDSTTYTLKVADTLDSMSAWKFQLSKFATILSAADNYKGFGLYLDVASKTQVRSKDIITDGDTLVNGMKWTFVPSTSVAAVSGDLVMDEGIYNLRNSYYFMYLIEDNGKAVYGNAKPSDKNAQWEFFYDAGSGFTALRNVESGNYLYAKGDSGQLVLEKSETFYWKLKRHTNEDYPNAVIFQDSLKSNCYLHMESLNGFAEDSNAVQPTWGTPHWDPILYSSENEVVATEITIPEGYIRLFNSAKEGEYLYENSSGAVIYKKSSESDARSHWKIIVSEVDGVYYLQNRETGNYMTNKGNGTLRCLPEEQKTNDGSLWQISAGNAENEIMLNSYYEDVKEYLRPYLNIQRMSGFAQCGVVSTEEETTKWKFELAKDETAAAAEAEEEVVPLNKLVDANQYKLRLEGQYLESIYQLEYYGNIVFVQDTKAKKYLYFDNGIQLKDLKGYNDKALQWQLVTKAGESYLKKGDTKLFLETIAINQQQVIENAYPIAEKNIFTVNADSKATYQVEFDYSGKNTKATIYVNGIAQGDIELKAGVTKELPLNKGINTIAVTNAEGLKGVLVKDSIGLNYRGATVPYVAYQAEDCVTTGTILDENREYHEITSEAAGRLAVNLDGTGQNIKITLTKAANALTLRYCIPDSEDGLGLEATLNLYIDGKKSQSINLTSKYSWVYGNYPWTNNPADGQPHHFFDETSILLDQTYPAGTVIKLQKDSANSAEYYIIDEVDAEEVAPANEQPENSLSITDFGAVADDGQDDTKALSDCIKAALEQGKEVWIPKGVFDINTPTSDYDLGDQQDKNRGIVLTEDNVVIRGAGMWHSVLQGDYAAFFIKASNISLYDFALKGTAIQRRDAIDPSAIESDYNTYEMKNLTVQNLWIQHYKTGIWTHNLDGLHVVGNRIRDTFADGMNLRRGTSNAIVEQNDVRNTGDDAIALWSSDYSDTNVKIRFNTVGLQWLANNIAVYGGKDIQITDNIIYDTVVNGAGINISTNFNPKPFEGIITIARNTLLRCGSQDYNNNQNDGAIWFNTVQGNDNLAKVIVKDNLIVDSTFQGISFANRGSIRNVTLESNAIVNAGSYGIDVLKGAKGNVLSINNYVEGSMLEPTNNSSEANFIFTNEVREVAGSIVEEKKSNIWSILIPVIGGVVAVALAAGLILRKKIRR